MNDDAATLDRFRIHELICQYVDFLNHRDWDAYRDLWVEDSIFEMNVETVSTPARDSLSTYAQPNNIRRVGISEIMELVANYGKLSWLFQMPHGIVAELIDSTTARVRHTLHIDSQTMKMLGVCYDRVRKGEDGRWRFVQRDFRPSYFENFEAPGLCVRTMPSSEYRTLP